MPGILEAFFLAGAGVVAGAGRIRDLDVGGRCQPTQSAHRRRRPRDRGGPEELARLHRRFECIHPFIDGKGRAGRLLLNLLLIRLGWPPAIILKEQRQRYLHALERSDDGDDGPLAEVISRSVVDNLHRLIPNIAGPAEHVLLGALVDDDFSRVALKQAASRSTRRDHR